MCSSSPERAPKSQLSVEQTLTGKCRTHQKKKKKKRYPASKDDREAATRWTSTRLGKTETPLLEGTQKNALHAPGHRGKEQ